MVEVTKIGADSYTVMQQVHRLQDEIVLLSKASWNDERRQLQHGNGTELRETPAMADRFVDVKFPVHDNFLEFPGYVKWSRVTVEGFIIDPGESVLNKQDGKVGKGWVRDCTIANTKGQGILLRVVHPAKNDLDFFDERTPVTVKYAKVFPGGIYADVHDLSQIEEPPNSDHLATLCPNVASVQRIPWN